MVEKLKIIKLKICMYYINDEISTIISSFYNNNCYESLYEKYKKI